MRDYAFKEKWYNAVLWVCAFFFVGAFFTGCSHDGGISADPETAKPLWEVGNERNKIVTVSDVHLGIDDRYSETLTNRTLFVEFLKRLHNTSDVRELVIVGDFLDSWYLPVYYPSYTDENKFFQDDIANNKEVFEELNHVVKSGIKLVYVPGNHDMTMEQNILKEAVPGIVQVSDAQGLGTYYTGDRKEIAIEHGHRYDVFSAPDHVTNKELCGNDKTILPAGYFYARYAATWVLEGKPVIKKDYPEVKPVPDPTDADQSGAYAYYALIANVSQHLTPKEDLSEKIFKMHIAGFDNDYTYLDFYPQKQSDGTISGLLFKNIQRTWSERQTQNNVKVPNLFTAAVLGTLESSYFYNQAKVQYLNNKKENVDIVVFGHTHVPVYNITSEGKYYINDGTWVDNNTDYPQATRTFVVITTGNKDAASLYKYQEDGTIVDIGTGLIKRE